MQTHFPLHRVALDDAAGTEYYVSARSGEAVMKSDRRTRMLGLFGYITHTFFFFRQQSWWSALLQWVSWIGLAMCLTGAVVGVWRYGLTPRYRHKRIPSHSPYTGWMKWHHYAGLLFGLFTITWTFSGLVSLDVIPGIRETRYSAQQIAEGARSVQGEGAVLDLSPLSLDTPRTAAATVSSSFAPTELELLQFGSVPYLIAYRPPTPDTVAQGHRRDRPARRRRRVKRHQHHARIRPARSPRAGVGAVGAHVRQGATAGRIGCRRITRLSFLTTAE